MTTDSCTATKLVFAPGQCLEFAYVNWRGERAIRVADPISMRHGSTGWHPEPQWLVLARDVERSADREFALADMTPSEGARILFQKGQRADIRRGNRLIDEPEASARPVALRFGAGSDNARAQWFLEASGEAPNGFGSDLPIGQIFLFAPSGDVA